MKKTEDIPDTMRAMVLPAPGAVLTQMHVPVPKPDSGQVLIKVMACGVCRTDLHILDGDLKEGKYPLIPGHEVVGKVIAVGRDVSALRQGDVVGVPWLAYTCGKCQYCRDGKENLCERALFTGYTTDGGYAEYLVAYERYCFPIPPAYQHPWAAPLLCAGLIGYRSYRMLSGDCTQIGIYGFGAAAHILIQIAVAYQKQIYAFTRKGDIAAQQLALELGAVWAGDSSQKPPGQLDGAILFAPAGELVPKALSDTGKGATVVCGGIHMSDIPSFPYKLLWQERVVRSVANLTVADGHDFFEQICISPVQTRTELFPLAEADLALRALREGKIHGAAVLYMD